jgi:hypothetical protein
MAGCFVAHQLRRGKPERIFDPGLHGFNQQAPAGLQQGLDLRVEQPLPDLQPGPFGHERSYVTHGDLEPHG